MPYLTMARGAWEASPQWTAFKNKLDLLATRVRVKKIVCIALGQHIEQHVLASCMARYLREVYSSYSSWSPSSNGESEVAKIDICAFDPCYEYADMVALEALTPVPIHVVSDPYHYLAIDEHTLVFSVSHPCFVPYHEIVADLLYPSGPAAFLTNEFWDDFEWFGENRVAGLDAWTPRVTRMMGLYGKDALGDTMR